MIHGAAGGVGSFAVQLARLAGTYVVAAGSARNRDYLRSLAAHQFIDYTAQQFENLVSNFDTVIDLIGGETQDRSWMVIKCGGALVLPISTPNAQKALKYGVIGKNFATRSDGRQLAEIAKLFAEKKLHAEVEVVPLSSAVEALMLSREGRTRGKLVFDVNR